MTFDEFVDKLYEAGWSATGDAQWEHIKKLWYELLEVGMLVHLPPNKANEAAPKSFADDE